MVIYTDGGYSIPKGIGGWAMVVTKDDKVTYIKNGTEKNSTSNRMEMTAFIEALKYTDKPVTIVSDSNYVVMGYNNWCRGWSNNNWKKADNKDVKNKDLWVIIDSLRRDNVTVEWIKAHNGHKFNELVDSLTRDYV